MTTATEVPSASQQHRVDGQAILRASVLALAGLTITFTPQLHRVGFNATLFGATALMLCVGMLAGYYLSRPERRHAGTRILAAVSGIAGVLSFTALANLGLLTIIIASWAALSAIVEVWSGRKRGGRQVRDSAVLAVLSGLLAVLLVGAPGDDISVIGYFGAYCILAAVFLAIGAFDRAPDAQTNTGKSE